MFLCCIVLYFSQAVFLIEELLSSIRLKYPIALFLLWLLDKLKRVIMVIYINSLLNLFVCRATVNEKLIARVCNFLGLHLSNKL